jgi:hypothetical protein
MSRRDQRKREKQRAQAAAPERMARGPGLVVCYLNPGWREDGMITLLVEKQASAGRAFAAFLIDNWCCGLKDCWGEFDIAAGGFDRLLDQYRERMSMVAIGRDQAAGLLASGIRFARQNGFRLPRKYERWTHLLGELDVEQADLSAFGVDGKLRYWGPLEDLRERLIGCTPEQFLSRADVEVVIPEDLPAGADDGRADAEESEDEQAAEEALWEECERHADATAHWLAGRGVVPHEMLVAAWLILFTQTGGVGDDPTGEPIAPLDELQGRVDDLLEQLPVRDRKPMRTALGQIEDFTRSFPDPRLLIEYVDAHGGDDD